MSNRMWGGRFSSGPDAIMEEINASIGFDQRLYKQDIAGSIAHATMLAEAGILTQTDRDAIVTGLNAVLAEIESQKFNFSRALEDIHMNVESRLRETDRRCGRAAAHGALAQRPGGDRFPALCAGRDRYAAGAGQGAAAGAGRARRCRSRDDHAGLHASAERAAGDVRPSPARLCRNAGARRRAAGAMRGRGSTKARSARRRWPGRPIRSIAR